MFGVLRPSTPPSQERLPISPLASPPAPRSLAPMPPSEFPSREDLLAGCKEWAADQGYAVVIARSRFNRLWLKCDRGGVYENRRGLTPEQRKRKRGESRLLGCRFRMLASVVKKGGDGSGGGAGGTNDCYWKVETEVPEHNHGPSEDLSAHPTLRRMTEEQVAKVNEMCEAGRSPAETLEELRATWPDIKVLTRDIYNARKKYKTQKEVAEAEAAAAAATGAQAEEVQQPYEDPNGVFPGPSTNGRWAWLEDGDEVMSKKTRRRRRTATAAVPNAVNATLDPQLQTPSPSHALHQPVSDAGQQLLNAINQNHSQPTHLPNNQPRYSGYHSAPNTYPRHPPANNHTDHFPSYQNSDHAPGATLTPYPTHHPLHTTPSRLRPHRQTAPTAPMAAAAVTAGGPSDASPSAIGAPKMQSGQVIMSRIERMEKEQRDQKSMLEQILGAVKEQKAVADR